MNAHKNQPDIGTSRKKSKRIASGTQKRPNRGISHDIKTDKR